MEKDLYNQDNLSCIGILLRIIICCDEWRDDNQTKGTILESFDT